MKKVDPALDDRDLARVIALARVGIGAAAWLAPRRFTRLWTGEDGGDVATPLTMRAVGARDVGLGLGTLFALERDAPARGWLEAQVLADASDAVSTLLAFGDLPKGRRWLSVATASAGAYLNARLASSID